MSKPNKTQSPSRKPRRTTLTSLWHRVVHYRAKAILTKTNLMCFASIVGGTVSYSGLFVILLQIKFIRNLADLAGQEVILTSEVALGSMTAIITFTGIVFLFIDRTIAGRFFLIAAIMGGVLLVLTTALVIEVYPQPPEGLERFYIIGLVVGNCFIFMSNIAAFFSKLPAV